MHQIQVEELLIRAVREAGITGFTPRCQHLNHRDRHFVPELCFDEERVIVRAHSCQSFRCQYHYRTTSEKYDALANERRLKSGRDHHAYQKRGIIVLTYWEHEPLDNFVARLQRTLEERRQYTEQKAG